MRSEARQRSAKVSDRRTRYALFEGEFAEVDGIFRSSDQINELTQFGLEGSLRMMESLSLASEIDE